MAPNPRTKGRCGRIGMHAAPRRPRPAAAEDPVDRVSLTQQEPMARASRPSFYRADGGSPWHHAFPMRGSPAEKASIERRARSSKRIPCVPGRLRGIPPSSVPYPSFVSRAFCCDSAHDSDSATAPQGPRQPGGQGGFTRPLTGRHHIFPSTLRPPKGQSQYRRLRDDSLMARSASENLLSFAEGATPFVVPL